MNNPRSIAFWLLFIPFVGLLLLKYQDLAKPVLDLGVAAYPPSSSEPYQSVRYRWSAAKLPSQYQVTYAHGEGAVSDSYAAHEQLARRFDYRSLDGDRFTWRYRSDCAGRWGLKREQVWACVYSEILANDQPDLGPLLQRIRAGFKQEQLTTTEAARWLLAFVQAIPYKIPHDSPFGVLPPALVTSQRWGDCDSKSLLLIYLLRGVGIDAQLLSSVAHKHAMVAIDVPVRSSRHYSYYGREFAWAETTSKAPLGWVDPDMLVPNDWRLVPVVLRSAPST